MHKKFYFLGGLPRSGNTLLSALLNQHPEVYVSPLSPLSTMLWTVENMFGYENIQRNQENVFRFHSFQSNMAENFYSDINKPIIIDREKDWGFPLNIEIAKRYINEDIKIIVTVRDIAEIMASLYQLAGDRYLDDARRSDLDSMFNYLDNKEIFCEHLMRPDSNLKRSMMALSSCMLPQFKDMFHIVEYEDLVGNTQDTLDQIYDFIGVDRFSNDLGNILKVEEDRDELVGWPKNTHDVSKQISKSHTNAIDVFGQKIASKYSDMEFWRERN